MNGVINNILLTISLTVTQFNMDIKQNIEFREDYLRLYNRTGDNRYDYSKNGVLEKILPKVLFRGNAILVTFLQLIDVRIITMMKYIDKLKHFKHISYIE